MNPIITSETGVRLLQGIVTRSPNGEFFLRTAAGSTRVTIEGASVPLGEEVIFKFLRQEPGRLILTPLSRWEALEESLPFLKELPASDRGSWEGIIRAAMGEGLPLEKKILLSLRKWSLTAEKEWGVVVHPKVFAFLLAKDLPVRPATIIWALYSKFPSVQKEVWRLAAEALPSLYGGVALPAGEAPSGNDLLEILTALLKNLAGEGGGVNFTGTGEAGTASRTGEAGAAIETGETTNERTAAGEGAPPEKMLTSSELTQQSSSARISNRLLDEVGKAGEELPAAGKEEGSNPAQKAGVGQHGGETAEKTARSEEFWMGMLREVTRFLAGQARMDQSLPDLAFFLFPRPKQEVRWEGKGESGGGAEGYSFRLNYDSESLGKVEVIGAKTEGGLELMIGVEDVGAFEPYFTELQEHLQSKGWSIRRLRFYNLTEQKRRVDSLPPRVDGWV